MESNVQKMRDALETLLNIAYEVQDANSEYGPKTSVPTQFIIDKAKAALSELPRNCDVGTAEEQIVRFYAECNAIRSRNTVEPCACCPFSENGEGTEDCQLEWAQMPYEADEGGAE